MEENGTSVSELARYVGVSRQAVMGWREGSQPTYDKMIKIAKYFGKRLDYFGITNYKVGDERKQIGNVPIVGSIQAGYPVESYEHIDDYVNLSLDSDYSENLFALRVSGDSMIPIVMEGDIIVCEKSHDNIDGKICVITVDGESTLKKVKKDKSGITLIPFNPMYKELHYSPKQCELKNLTIDGVVIEMIRRFY